MATLELLDTTRTGRILGDLESKLRSLVVTQDEAIHEIVTAYQSHMIGLSPAGRPSGIFCSSGRLARARPAPVLERVTSHNEPTRRERLR